MEIYVVKSGDTLWRISNLYGVQIQNIVAANQITNPNQLVVGQALVIPNEKYYTVQSGDALWRIAQRFGVTIESIVSENQLTDPNSIYQGQVLKIPSDFYIVKSGDTLYAISRKLGVPIQDIIRVNQLTNPSQIDPGQKLIIPEKKKPLIEVNAYTTVLNQAGIQEVQAIGEYLTYLSPFSYQVQDDGTLKPLQDTEILTTARSKHVAPLLVVTNFKNGTFNSDLAHNVFTNQAVQDQLLQTIKQTLQEKRYMGLNIDFEYLYPNDRELYNNFLRRVVNELHPLGYSVSTAVAPKYSKDQKGLLYEAHDYEAHGEIVDFVVIMTYEWGWSGGEPMAVAPISEVRKVLGYALTAIPHDKLIMGMPLYGYDWKLPYVKGEQWAQTLSPAQSVQRAAQYGVSIQYDEASESPYYHYYDSSGTEHVVWFEDARSVNAKYDLAKELNLRGVSYWVLGNPFPQNWHVLADHFRIQKF